jgi:hypothetical protein
MRRRVKGGDFAFGVVAGCVTVGSWLVSELALGSGHNLRIFLAASVALVGAVILGRLRGQFGVALGYLLGLSQIVVLALILLFVFGAVQGLEALHEISDRLQRRPFDASVWRQHADDGTRTHMVDDLVSSKRIEGLTLSQAQVVLGPPSKNLGGSECDLAYWLDTYRGWLCLSGGSGHITSVGFREYHD